MILRWAPGSVVLLFDTGPEQPVVLRSLRPAGTGTPPALARAPLVEVKALGHGRFPGSHRYADTTVGARLRYRAHSEHGLILRIEQLDDMTGLVVTSVFEATPGVAAVRAWTELAVEGSGEVVVQAVTSAVTGAFLGDTGLGVAEFDVLLGDSDWVAESRWRRASLREAGLAAMDAVVHHHPSRGRLAVTSRSTWSTGERLPTGLVVAHDDSWALAWQIEHNGPWHWEIGETVDGVYIALLGPTDAEHQWHTRVTAEEPFVSVPVSLAVAAGGPDAAFAALTDQRRAGLRSVRRPDLPVVFNDYLNTLMGDPTTEKLLPLVDAAADVGAECFCVDAGWYAEDGGWWDGVGEWRPSATRFPGGLGEVFERVRARGMVPGLWLEPEVVGVRSPVADRLPDGAFLQRLGRRVVEHGRYHLDLRHPAARAHLDEVVDRLVAEFGVGYFKLDYNVMPGPGTDLGGLAPGAGLLEHNRAHLAWLDDVLRRHPRLLLENCASGAMRMDYAMLSRMHLQSTSDQQNPLLYPAIAAAAPASVLPEQAGNWACAQPEMSVEDAVHTLATGLLGRLYLSGRLDLMDAAQLSLVREAVAVHQRVRADIGKAWPFWPLGLPSTRSGWLAMGLRAPERTLLTVWRHPGASSELSVPVPHLRGVAAKPEVLFPSGPEPWPLAWDAAEGRLHVSAPAEASLARVLDLNH